MPNAPRSGGHWRLDPTAPLAGGLLRAYLGRHTGTTRYHDSSRHLSHGVLTNFAGSGNTPPERWSWAALSPAAPPRACLRLDGSSDYVALDAGLSITATGLTVAGWFNFAANPGGGSRVWLATKGSGSGYEWALQFNDLSYSSQSYFAATRWTSDGSSESKVVSAATGSLGTWYHLAAVYPSPSSIPLLYVDGVYDVGTSGGSPCIASAATASVARVGARGDGAASPLNGSVADLLVWCRALRPSEVAALADPANDTLRSDGHPLVVPVRRRRPVAPASAAATVTPFDATPASFTVGTPPVVLSLGTTLPSQAGVYGVRVSEGDADLRVSWRSTDPPGTTYQVYVDGVLTWHGRQRFCHLVRPAGRTSRINILAVDPGDARTARIDALAPPADRRARLWWYGGTYLGDVAGYNIYASAEPGGAVDYSAAAAFVGAYPKNTPYDGYGLGPYGAGGYGASAQTYSWVSDNLPAGVWNFAVKPFDSAGNEGTATVFSVTIAGPPPTPPPYPDGARVTGSYDGTTRVLTLTWQASTP